MRGWTHLERQKGGIGLRGPGETQLETDRRLIGKRIRTLERAAREARAAPRHAAAVRKRVPVPAVALVGYTNAGKSTLFSALTGADAYVADQLFATLDPTVRRLRLPHTPDLVVADTVGFVRDLPHELVAAFRSTLMEAREADLLLHVIDAADPEREQRIAQVDALVASIGAASIPQLRIYNKIDRLGRAPEVMRDAAGLPTAIWLSAATGTGVGFLRAALQEIFGQAAMRLAVVLPPSQGRLRARLYELRLVRAEEALAEGETRLDRRILAPGARSALPGGRRRLRRGRFALFARRRLRRIPARRREFRGLNPPSLHERHQWPGTIPARTRIPGNAGLTRARRTSTRSCAACRRSCAGCSAARAAGRAAAPTSSSGRAIGIGSVVAGLVAVWVLFGSFYLNGAAERSVITASASTSTRRAAASTCGCPGRSTAARS